MVLLRRRRGYAFTGAGYLPHLPASLMRMHGRRGGSTGGGDSSVLVARPHDASILVGGDACDTDAKVRNGCRAR